MLHAPITLETPARRRALFAWAVLFALLGLGFYAFALIHLGDVFAAIASGR